jgi:hypothetical protein
LVRIGTRRDASRPQLHDALRARPGAFLRRAIAVAFRVTDLDRIFSSGADFARKFDLTIDPTVMDELDRAVAA